MSTTSLTRAGETDTGNLTVGGTLAVTGTTTLQGYTLPLFQNGSRSGYGNIIIPVLFASSNYVFCEIRGTFVVSTTCNVAIAGNTNASNTGTALSPAEFGEATFFSTTTKDSVPTVSYTNNGLVAASVIGQSIAHQFRITLSKGSGSGTYATRVFYFFETTYQVSGATARTSGVGHLDPASGASLGSLILNLNAGATTTAYWSTIHSY